MMWPEIVCHTAGLFELSGLSGWGYEQSAVSTEVRARECWKRMRTEDARVGLLQPDHF